MLLQNQVLYLFNCMLQNYKICLNLGQRVFLVLDKRYREQERGVDGLMDINNPLFFSCFLIDLKFPKYILFKSHLLSIFLEINIGQTTSLIKHFNIVALFKIKQKCSIDYFQQGQDKSSLLLFKILEIDYHIRTNVQLTFQLKLWQGMHIQ